MSAITAEPRAYEATAVASVSVPPAGSDGNPDYTTEVSERLRGARTTEYAALAATPATAAAVGRALAVPYTPEQLLRGVTISERDGGLLVVRAEASTPGGAARLATTWMDVVEAQVLARTGGARYDPLARVMAPDRDVRGSHILPKEPKCAAPS